MPRRRALLPVEGFNAGGLRQPDEVLLGIRPERGAELSQAGGAAVADRGAQVLQHVVNHATYHRGQITTMLRQMNVPPPKSMDLIAFYRERATVTA